MSHTLIRGGRIIDPHNDIDTTGDIEIRDGLIQKVGDIGDVEAAHSIDATGKVVIPGIIDLCARLREPGQEHKAHIKSESIAAARSGITTLCCPPDTDPVIDEPAVVDLINHKASRAAASHVVPIGALTEGLRGELLAEMWSLQKAGCVGVSNARHPVENTTVLRRAFSYAANCGFTVHICPDDHWLSEGGCAHDGRIATRLGLQGIPVAAETTALARVIELISDTGVRAHIGRVSSAQSIRQIERAKQWGLPVTVDVAAHQLHLNENDISTFNPNCHVIPPLRTQRDMEALRKAVAEGVVDAICSDHQPHNIDAKQAPFASTEAGISALETLLPLTLKLVEEGLLDLSTAVRRLTATPADILGLPCGKLDAGSPADITILDLSQEWTFEPDNMHSRGQNTPFGGWAFTGKAITTLVSGKIID